MINLRKFSKNVFKDDMYTISKSRYMNTFKRRSLKVNKIYNLSFSTKYRNYFKKRSSSAYYKDTMNLHSIYENKHNLWYNKISFVADDWFQDVNLEEKYFKGISYEKGKL